MFCACYACFKVFTQLEQQRSVKAKIMGTVIKDVHLAEIHKCGQSRTTKGTSMDFKVNSVDKGFVVPGFGGLTPRGTMLMCPRYFSPIFAQYIYPYIILIHYRPVNVALRLL